MIKNRLPSQSRSGLRRLAAHAGIGVLAAIGFAGQALAWEFEDFMNAQGDRGLGIVSTAANEPGIELAFGCEGDRWRQVALLPAGKTPLLLDPKGRVKVGFREDKIGPAGTWKVRKPAGKTVFYVAPSPTQFMGRLYDEESRDSSAALYLQVVAEKTKKPVTLKFPLKGLRAALAKKLWKPCKLDVYFGSPE